MVNANNMHKTQRYIREAFLDLLETKSFHQITVRDIVAQAELARSTFYIYYDDKYQLLEEIEQELIGGFIDIMLRLRKEGHKAFRTQIAQGNHPLYVEYFKYIKKHSRPFRILLNYKSETNFMPRFSNAINATRNETDKIFYVENKEHRDDTLAEYRDTILSSVYVSLFTTWLERGMDYSPEHMGSMLTAIWNSGAFSKDILSD